VNKKVLVTRTVLVGALQSGLFWFDRIVEGMYPIVILKYGPVRGVLGMMILSFFVCWALLTVYDRVCTIDPLRFKTSWLRTLIQASSDVLGFESIKETGSKALESVMVPATWQGSWFSKIKFIFWEPLRRYLFAPVMTFLASRGWGSTAKYLTLSLLTDGMTTVIMMRPARSHKMGLREWMLFVPSVLLSCIGWGAFVTGAVALWRSLS
jgi:hypothetical protein